MFLTCRDHFDERKIRMFFLHGCGFGFVLRHKDKFGNLLVRFTYGIQGIQIRGIFLRNGKDIGYFPLRRDLVLQTKNRLKRSRTGNNRIVNAKLV